MTLAVSKHMSQRVLTKGTTTRPKLIEIGTPRQPAPRGAGFSVFAGTHAVLPDVEPPCYRFSDRLVYLFES